MLEAAAPEKRGDPIFGSGANPTFYKNEVLLSGFAGFSHMSGRLLVVVPKSEAALFPHVFP